MSGNAEEEMVDSAEIQSMSADSTAVARATATSAGAATVTGFIDTIRGFYNALQEIERKSYDVERVGMFEVDCSLAKDVLMKKATTLASCIIEAIITDARESNQAVIMRYKMMMKRISIKPKNEKELKELSNFVDGCTSDIQHIENECKDIHDRLSVLDEFGARLPAADFTLAWNTRQWPTRIMDKARANMYHLELVKEAMMEKLDKEKEAFELELSKEGGFSDRVKAFYKYEDVSQGDSYATQAADLQQQLSEAQAQVVDFNAREEIFGLTQTTYSDLDTLRDNFEPYFKLWTTMSDFHAETRHWLQGSFLELDPTGVEKMVVTWWKSVYKLEKDFDSEPVPRMVSETLLEELAGFKEYLPLLSALASKALYNRHWEKLSERIGSEIVPDDELTLQQLLEIGVNDHMDIVQDVSMIAEKQYSLEKALVGMQQDWVGCDYLIEAYKETKTFIVKATEDIYNALDDQIVKVQTMRGSPYITPIEKEVKKWEQKLTHAQNLLDEWLALQRVCHWSCVNAVLAPTQLPASYLAHNSPAHTHTISPTHTDLDVSRTNLWERRYHATNAQRRSKVQHRRSDVEANNGSDSR